MGASASLLSPRSWNDSELKELIDEVESMHNDINRFHKDQLKVQASNTFKKHEKIITMVTSKTKRQLDHMTSVDPNFNKKALFELVGGKDYGKFLSRLSTPDLFLKKHDLKVACEGLGVDDDAIAFILCTSDTQMLVRLMEYCTLGGLNLQEMIEKKCKKDSFPQQLFRGILADKSRSNDDATLAPDNAKSLVTADTTNVAPFFEVITTASYEQIKRIDAALLSGHSISLDKLIDKKFGKMQVALYCKLCVRPPVEAVALLVSLVGKNSTRMMQIFSREDKEFYRGVDNAVRASYDSSGLVHYIKGVQSGKLQTAICGWLVNRYHDNGAEREAEHYIQENKAQGYDLAAVLAWDEGCAKLRTIFEKAKEELASVIRQQNVPKAGEPVPAEDVSEYTSGHPNMGPQSTKYKLQGEDFFSDGINAAANPNETKLSLDDWDVKAATVQTFLTNLFQKKDTDNTGVLPEDVFWSTFMSLPLAEMGMSEHEVEGMREWTDWAADGEVVYVGVCMDELVDTLIGIIENMHSDRTVKEVLDDFAHHASTTPAVESNPSPDLMNYLHESFNAHSTSGGDGEKLSKDEFYAVVEMLNLGLTEHDISQLVEQSDHNHDSVIEWKEAIPTLNNLLHDMCSDERDHWIGLMDPVSKQGFWYNVRDKQSSWMSEEDNSYFVEAGYAHRMHF